MAPLPPSWDIYGMADKAAKKRESEMRARAIHRRLMAMPRPGEMSNNDLAKKAGVNTSFFSQLKGNEKKVPSEPSVGNLRLVLEALGSSIPEFFLHEARGRLVPVPSQQALERAFSEALSALPAKAEDRPRYLAEVVRDILALPTGQIARLSDAETSAPAVPEEGALPRVATKRG